MATLLIDKVNEQITATYEAAPEGWKTAEVRDQQALLRGIRRKGVIDDMACRHSVRLLLSATHANCAHDSIAERKERL